MISGLCVCRELRLLQQDHGALGGVIVFLVWLWLTNIAILLGAEYNAERARTQLIKAEHAPDQEPYLPARSLARSQP